MAVLLHYLYLSVFFLMLAEGLHLAYTVLKPLSSRNIAMPLLAGAYGKSSCDVYIPSLYIFLVFFIIISSKIPLYHLSKSSWCGLWTQTVNM